MRAPTQSSLLKFPVDKKHNPTGYINIGQAIDRLGRHRLGDAWGTPPAFAELPFFKGSKGEFVRYTLTKDATRYVLKSHPLETLFTKTQLIEVRRAFVQTYKELQQALLQRKIKTYLLETSTGKLDELFDVNLIGIRSRTIFSTGYITRESGKARFRILIPEAELNNFLSGSVSTAPTGKLSVTRAQSLIRLITEALTSVGCRLPRKVMFNVFHSELPSFSERTFNRDIWDQLPASVRHRGAPSKSLRDGGEDREKAVDAVRSALQNFSPNPKSG